MKFKSSTFCFLLFAFCFIAYPACAATKKTTARKTPTKQSAAKQATAPVQSAHRKSPYVGAISADAKTGKVIFSANADAEAYPASVTKLMTLLLVLEDVKAGKYKLDDKVVATPDVNKCEPSWIGLEAGDSMSVRDLCYALMVESANDSAIALGVHSADSFGGFIARMNARAKELGMAKTEYFNPNGLPPSTRYRYPWKNFNVTTASDQLKLALEILKMSEVLEFTSVKTCDLVQTTGGYYVVVTRRVNAPPKSLEDAVDPGKKIARIVPRTKVKVVVGYDCMVAGESKHFANSKQEARDWCLKSGYDLYVETFCNHNNVMVKDKLKIFNPDGSEAVDGLKTGYIYAGGSSIVITAKRNGKRVVAVVLGSASAKERDAAAVRLVSDGLSAVAW